VAIQPTYNSGSIAQILQRPSLKLNFQPPLRRLVVSPGPPRQHAVLRNSHLGPDYLVSFLVSEISVKTGIHMRECPQTVDQQQHWAKGWELTWNWQAPPLPPHHRPLFQPLVLQIPPDPAETVLYGTRCHGYHPDNSQ
jgi:hypothetical protein